MTRAPRLILLPGLHGTMQLSAPLLRLIPDSLRPAVITFDDAGEQTYDAIYRAILPRIPLDEPMMLLAESFSGPLAIRFAVEHRQIVRGVIFSGSYVRAPVPRFLQFLPLRGLFAMRPPDFAIRLGLCGNDCSAELILRLRRILASWNPPTIAARVRTTINADASSLLSAYDGPLLCLVGRRDRLVRRKSLRQIRDIRPDVHVVEIDSPHLILQTHPRQGWLAIERFINECCAGDSLPPNTALTPHRSRDSAI